jgi:hypothetical protein
MSHTSTPHRTPALAALLILLLAAVGLAACGGSSSTTSTAANAAAAAKSSGGTTAPGGTSSAPGGTSSTPGGTSTAPGTPGARPGAPYAARFAAVRACLAKKGIVLPPRTPGSPGFLGGRPPLPKGVTQAQYAEALKSCGGGFAGGRVAGGGRFNGAPATAAATARFHEMLARFAACLRQNGVNIGEPNTSGKGPVFNTKGINTAGPAFRAAETKCRASLVAALRPPKAVPGAAAGSPSG